METGKNRLTFYISADHPIWEVCETKKAARGAIHRILQELLDGLAHRNEEATAAAHSLASAASSRVGASYHAALKDVQPAAVLRDKLTEVIASAAIEKALRPSWEDA